MLPRHRRRLTMMGDMERRPPRFLMRLVIGALIVFIAWYLVAKILTMFDGTAGKESATLLTVRSGADSVQVSLQEGDWQRGETNLKLYAGDAVALRGAADVVLRFFDGTRLRLDASTELLIDESDNRKEGSSSIAVTVRTGRVWVASPTALAYSGTIVRTVRNANFSSRIPADSQLLFGAGDITILRTSGIGMTTKLLAIKNRPEIVISEGQRFSLNETSKQAMENGADPYDSRDPVTAEILKDEFLATSYALLSRPEQSSATVENAPVNVDAADLTVTSPDNNARLATKTVKVTGRVSDRVKSLLVNGHIVPIQNDKSFVAEVSPSIGTSSNIRIEAQDAQGVTLATVDRTVVNEYVVVVDPVRIKSPVGSGETLTTSQTEIEITGEAPASTAVVMINDYKLMLYTSGDKTWSYLASTALGNLQTGKNVFTVVALDRDGNRSPARSITIDFTNNQTSGSGTTATQPPLKQNPPLTPGVLSVQAPEAGVSATTAQKEIVIEGQTSADTSSISINGYTLSLYLAGKTTWNYIASTELQTMRRGKNVYRVVARNAGGEILDILEYTINYKP